MKIRGGPKVKVTLLLFEHDLDDIDALCKQHDCSRASVIEAWKDEYEDTDLTGKVKAGRRPGGGRKPWKGTKNANL